MIVPLGAAVAVAASRPRGTMRQSCAAAAATRPVPLLKGQTWLLMEGDRAHSHMFPGRRGRAQLASPGAKGEKPFAGRGQPRPQAEGPSTARTRPRDGEAKTQSCSPLRCLPCWQLAASHLTSSALAWWGNYQLTKRRQLGWIPASGSGSAWGGSAMLSAGLGCGAVRLRRGGTPRGQTPDTHPPPSQHWDVPIPSSPKVPVPAWWSQILPPPSSTPLH